MCYKIVLNVMDAEEICAVSGWNPHDAYILEFVKIRI
jgi:hypothetical protein